jgi:alkylation response protein AidB-like acyl-CoA dehydrogenase
MTGFDLYTTTKEHDRLRETVRALVAAKVAPYAAEVDESSEFPQAAYDALRAAQLHAIHVPEEYGGVGADALATCIVIEEIARACASSSLIPAVNKLGSLPLILAGTEELKERYLPQLAAGNALFSYAQSEREAGSDAASMRTRAIHNGDTYVLNGVKRWITNAGVSEYYTVFAVTEPSMGVLGISAFIVEKTDAGVSFGPLERKLGIKGSPTRELHLDDVRIPASRLIGAPGEGLKIALRTIEHTRVTIAAQAIGIAQGALDQATAYVKERKQFGMRLADFQGIQFMIADMAMKLAAVRQLTYTAAAKSERNDPDLPFFSAAAKCLASDTAMKVTTDAVQLLGGYGYIKDFPVERMMRDAKVTQIYEGTNEIQRTMIARYVLS